MHEKTHWHRVSSARTPGRLLVAQETNDLGRPVVDPTQPAKGKPLLTLKDAADYIHGIKV